MITKVQEIDVRGWKISNPENPYYFSIEAKLSGNTDYPISGSDYCVIEGDDPDNIDSISDIQGFLQGRSSLGAIFDCQGTIIILVFIGTIGLIEFNRISIKELNLQNYIKKGISEKYRKCTLTHYISEAKIDDLCSIFGEEYKEVVGEFYRKLKSRDKLVGNSKDND